MQPALGHSSNSVDEAGTEALRVDSSHSENPPWAAEASSTALRHELDSLDEVATLRLQLSTVSEMEDALANKVALLEEELKTRPCDSHRYWKCKRKCEMKRNTGINLSSNCGIDDGHQTALTKVLSDGK